MLFSVVIPSYKGRYLGEAIDSVIAQTCGDWELIVVNDCSPEDLGGVVGPRLSDSRIRYFVNERNLGAERLCENWNGCLKFCSGDYVICMGDDDRLSPCCLDEYRRLIERYPQVDVLHGQTVIIDECGDVCELLEPRREHESALELIYFRWAGMGRQQFVGDFCYKRVPLMERGGFFVLPFAWGSDDISAVMAATPCGIANTERVCFEYRKNRFSISSDGHFRGKADALLLQWEWFESYLGGYVSGTRQELVTTGLLKVMMPRHFRLHINDMIRKDLRVCRCNVLFWLRNRRRYGVTVREVLIQFVKSFEV